ncbi:MAG: hypothetical protein ACM3UP_00895 [Methanocella sp.]
MTRTTRQLVRQSILVAGSLILALALGSLAAAAADVNLALKKS